MSIKTMTGGAYRRHGRPRPPTKDVTVWRYRQKHKRKVPTEVHEAFTSLGERNRTHRLSDGEFYRQGLDEVAYLGRLSCHHFKRAMSAFSELINLFK